MSRRAAGWGLKHAISAIGTIIIGGTTTVPVVTSPSGAIPAATSTASKPPIGHHENNWG